jgi:hypothetical protein
MNFLNIIKTFYFEDFDFSSEKLDKVNENLLFIIEDYLISLIEENGEIGDTLNEVERKGDQIEVSLTLSRESGDTDAERKALNTYSQFIGQLYGTEDFKKYSNALLQEDHQKMKEIMSKYVDTDVFESSRFEAEKETTFFSVKIPLKKVKSEETLKFYEKRLNNVMNLFESSLKEENLFEF